LLPDTAIMLRYDCHYGRPEIMAWCEAYPSAECRLVGQVAACS
jgi:hypothetical protein